MPLGCVWPRPQELGLLGCHVTPLGLAALPSPPLTSLIATHCGSLSSDKGCAQIACYADSLQEVELRGAGAALTDQGLAALGGLARLRILDVTGSSISSDGLRAFAASPAGKSLELLGLESCRSLDRPTRAVAGNGWPGLRKHLLRR